ncbi:MAG: GNAT family N-acetyltransferase [Geminicoccaceae bacterium]
MTGHAPASAAREQPRIVGKVRSVVSHLEMFAPPGGTPLQPPCEGTEIVRALNTTLSFYRFLYGSVGGPWVWWRRHHMADAELAAAVHDQRVDIRVLWVHGVPAGYAEIDGRKGDDAELAYFGLMPEFIGRGLGAYFLDAIVRHAWSKPIRRFWVHTCELDHPRALGGYERAGFALFDREEGYEYLLEGMALPQHVADRTVEEP